MLELNTRGIAIKDAIDALSAPDKVLLRAALELGDGATLNVGSVNGTLADGGHLHGGVYEPADASILKDADIGVAVQAFSAILAATTASFLIEHLTKLGHITVTQAVSLDQMESDIAAAIASVATHAALTATHGATGAIVGTTNTQTLTNKTLTSPVVETALQLGHATDTPLTRPATGRMLIAGAEVMRSSTAQGGTGSTVIQNTVGITQTAYDLMTPDATTLYVITGA